MSAGIIRRTIRHRANRRHNPRANRPQPTAPIQVTLAVAAMAVLTVTYNQAVCLAGVPKYSVDVVGATPVSAAQTGPTTVAITYSTSIAAATSVTIPYEDPAVRNSSGGFVATSTFGLA
jgi:hypothetical protein